MRWSFLSSADLEPPVVLGYDAAGVVEAIGPGVTRFTAGDEVYYTPEIVGNRMGGHAEYNVVPADLVALKPSGLSFVEDRGDTARGRHGEGGDCAR